MVAGGVDGSTGLRGHGSSRFRENSPTAGLARILVSVCMGEGVTILPRCMMDLCPVRWAQDPCLAWQDICRHGHNTSIFESIETFPSPSVPRPRMPGRGVRYVCS